MDVLLHGRSDCHEVHVNNGKARSVLLEFRSLPKTYTLTVELDLSRMPAPRRLNNTYQMVGDPCGLKGNRRERT